MRGVIAPFNPVLVLLLVLAGCATGPSSSSGKSDKPGKPIKYLRIHLETRHDIPQRSMAVEVGRSTPMRFTVEKVPILSENQVESAALIEQSGGIEVRLKFNPEGAMALQNYTSAAVGRHLVLMTDIDEEVRWIAAPLIRGRMDDGVLIFTPAATKAEMERLVRGLNGEVRRKKKQWLDRE